MRQRKARLFLLTTLLVLLAVLAYGFAAQNTVPTSYAGDGQAAVSGYHVVNVHYVLDTTTPSQVTGVQFELQDANGNTLTAQSVYAAVSANGSSWTWTAACQQAANSTVWNCTFGTPQAVQPIAYLRVAASQ